MLYVLLAGVIGTLAAAAALGVRDLWFREPLPDEPPSPPAATPPRPAQPRPEP